MTAVRRVTRTAGGMTGHCRLPLTGAAPCLQMALHNGRAAYGPARPDCLLSGCRSGPPTPPAARSGCWGLHCSPPPQLHSQKAQLAVPSPSHLPHISTNTHTTKSLNHQTSDAHTRSFAVMPSTKGHANCASVKCLRSYGARAEHF